MLKLNAKDRANIDILSAIYDHWTLGSKKNPHTTINYNRDQDTLINYGFEYGVSRGSMFGKDNTGQAWQVCAYGLLHKGNTVWYKIDERGLRHKVTPNLKWEDFYRLFSGGKRERMAAD